LGKFNSFSSGKKLLTDHLTGRNYWQLTNGNWVSHAPYTYCRAFSCDEKYLIYSANRTGTYQLYRLEIETGLACQLTDLAGYENFSLNMHPAGKEVFFLAASKVFALELESGECRLVTDYQPLLGAEAKLGRPCLSGDGTLVLNYYQRPDGRTAIASAGATGSNAEEIFVFSRFETIGHLNFCPTDNNLVSFVPLPDCQNDFSLPAEKRARAWWLNLANGESQPLITVPPGHRATHEYWSPNGERVYFHQKTHPGWTPTLIASVNKVGTDKQVHYQTNTIKLGHSSVNSAHTKLVSDSQQAGKNELVLLDLVSNTVEILCYPNASGAPHPNHVHPAFSLSGEKIIFTSDVSGYAQVYLLEL
jgi:oligogalacturonide lyase